MHERMFGDALHKHRPRRAVANALIALAKILAPATQDARTA